MPGHVHQGKAEIDLGLTEMVNQQHEDISTLLLELPDRFLYLRVALPAGSVRRSAWLYAAASEERDGRLPGSAGRGLKTDLSSVWLRQPDADSWAVRCAPEFSAASFSASLSRGEPDAG